MTATNKNNEEEKGKGNIQEDMIIENKEAPKGMFVYTL